MFLSAHLRTPSAVARLQQRSVAVSPLLTYTRADHEEFVSLRDAITWRVPRARIMRRSVQTISVRVVFMWPFPCVSRFALVSITVLTILCQVYRLCKTYSATFFRRRLFLRRKAFSLCNLGARIFPPIERIFA